MTDIRKGDIVKLHGLDAEVQSVVATSDGPVVTLLLEVDGKLARNVLRRGGPDEREDDKHVRPEEGHEVDADEDEDVDDEDVDVDEDDEEDEEDE